MRAEFVIEHSAGDFLQHLPACFGQHDPAALRDSVFAQKSPGSAQAIEYAATRPGYRILAWAAEGQVSIYVESLGGRLRDSAGDVWDLTRRVSGGLSPRLKRVVLFDEDANDVILEGTAGLLTSFRRPEVFLTLTIGFLSTIWLGVALVLFDATGDLVLGAIPAIGAAILALLTLFADWKSRRLRWQ